MSAPAPRREVSAVIIHALASETHTDTGLVAPCEERSTASAFDRAIRVRKARLGSDQEWSTYWLIVDSQAIVLCPVIG
jgi:hypothetical protein